MGLLVGVEFESNLNLKRAFRYVRYTKDSISYSCAMDRAVDCNTKGSWFASH